VLRLITDRFDPPDLDTAVSAAVLQRVAAGTDPATLRLWTPLPAVAFGRQDRARPGYRDAVAAVAGLGFTPVERLAGGRAAVFHEGTIAFSWAMPEARVRETIADRFAMVSGLIVQALASLGFDARIGEVAGEYCPGEWSVNLGGTHKVMGVGQRLIRGAAHIGGVVVVSGADRVNLPLEPAYRSLGYAWRPEATGALDQVDPGISPEQVIAALTSTVSAAGHELLPGSLDEACLRRAAELAPEHRPDR
jgi:octanoyl-[GcvH]:protein N-octanoyltransferase